MTFGLTVPNSKYGSYGLRKRAEKKLNTPIKTVTNTKKEKTYSALATAGLVLATAVLVYKGKGQISKAIGHIKSNLSKAGASASKSFPNLSAGIKSLGKAFKNGIHAITHPFKK